MKIWVNVCFASIAAQRSIDSDNRYFVVGERGDPEGYREVGLLNGAVETGCGGSCKFRVDLRVAAGV